MALYIRIFNTSKISSSIADVQTTLMHQYVLSCSVVLATSLRIYVLWSSFLNTSVSGYIHPLACNAHTEYLMEIEL